MPPRLYYPKRYPKLTAAQKDRAAKMIASAKKLGAKLEEALRPKLSRDERRELESRFESDGKRYIIQRPGKPGHGATCSLIALANACTYLGMPSIRPGSKRWERIAKLGGCVAGPCIRLSDMAEQLGLQLKPTSHRRAHLWIPFLLKVWTPETGFHSVLVVDGDKEALVLVNYLTGDNVRSSRVVMPRCELSITSNGPSYAITKG